MPQQTLTLSSAQRARRVGTYALTWLSALAVGCSKYEEGTAEDMEAAGASAGRAASGSGGSGGRSAADSGGKADAAKCGANDAPETGLQGDVYSGTVNCGLTLLSELPVGGHVQGSGHCACVRVAGSAPYTGSAIKAFSLEDPLNPVETDQETAVGGSESMRAHTVEGRAILVSGKGVYDVSDCEQLVKKGEIQWPSANAQAGLFFAALSSHEIAISHDAKRVYSGLGFAIAYIDDLEKPESWTVKNWSCEMNEQSGFPGDVPPLVDQV